MTDKLGPPLLVPTTNLLSAGDVLTRPSRLPSEPGVYGWWFRRVPSGVPVEGCRRHDSLTLLYVGISPKAPPKNGAAASRQNLRKRAGQHYRGNAAGSTLRLTLGCLLADELGIQLRRVGPRDRMTFTRPGEAILSAWMKENAYVSYQVELEPWQVEDQLIAEEVLPLNLRDNGHHPFHARLSEQRAMARTTARSLPIVKR
jgi:hypothetical protein